MPPNGQAPPPPPLLGQVIGPWRQIANDFPPPYFNVFGEGVVFRRVANLEVSLRNCVSICLKYPHACIQMGVVEEGRGGAVRSTHTELSTRKKKQLILNDMEQLHYMLTVSLISIPCQICYWTYVLPLCEKTEELYNQMSLVWCISAFS